MLLYFNKSPVLIVFPTFKPKKKYTGRRKIEYIAPKPKQKRVVEEEEAMKKERLYRVEVFTSDQCNAGTTANVNYK